MIYVEGSSAATLILLHGTGGSERDLLPIGRKIAPQAALLSLPGRVFEQDQRRYFRHLPNGGFDLADLALQSAWLLDTVQTQLTLHHRLAALTTVVGYSNGANIAAWSMLHQQTPWRDAIWFHPMFIGADNHLPDLSAARIWLSHGKNDPYASDANFLQLLKICKKAGAETAVYTHARGHQLTAAELDDAAAYFQRQNQ